MTHLEYRCFAKVNLTLEVIRRREDGYHDLASLVHTISLADELRLDPAGELRIQVEGLDLSPGANLIAQAARLFFDAARLAPGVELRLVKRVPSSAGLGGGSSDAASTLVGLNGLMRKPLSRSELLRLAAALGSDVPFFVDGGAALMTGRGEHVHRLPPLKRQWLVLAVPPHAVVDKTKNLYMALKPTDFSSGAATHQAAHRLTQGVPLDQEQLSNGFARAARCVFPDLSRVWTAAERVCERRFLLSGAGPTLFAFARDHSDAARQQTRLARLGVAALTARTVSHARAARRFPPPPPIGYP